MKDSYNPNSYPASLFGLPLEQLYRMMQDAETRALMHLNADRGYNADAVTYFQKEHARLAAAVTVSLAEQKMAEFYFTFGSNHYRLVSTGVESLANRYVLILAYSREQAREFMARMFGAKWAFDYTRETFAGQPEKYGLQQLTARPIIMQDPHSVYATCEA